MAPLRITRYGQAISVLVAVTCHTEETISRQMAFRKVIVVVTYRAAITSGSGVIGVVAMVQ